MDIPALFNGIFQAQHMAISVILFFMGKIKISQESNPTENYLEKQLNT
jgi:hypothetical protein